MDYDFCDFGTCYNYLVDNGIATERECTLACYLNGCTVDTLEDVLFVFTGYRDFDSYYQSEDPDYTGDKE